MSCFKGCSSLETVYFHEDVDVIEDQAFMDCISLTEIICQEHRRIVACYHDIFKNTLIFQKLFKE
jgi:hypothetical protein